MNKSCLFHAIAILILLTAMATAATAAQSAPFTYQGKLTDSVGKPLSGAFDMTFSLFDTDMDGKPIIEPLVLKAVPVTDGLFTVSLDFGTDPFQGKPLWLETAIQDKPLTPRTQLTSVPTAIYALTVADGSVTAAKIPSAQVVKSINSLKDNVTLSPGAGISIVPSGNTLTISAASASAWCLTGNDGTTSGTNFLGTTDNQPLELRVNSARALRIEPTATWPNIIGGHSSNSIPAGVLGGSIHGGSGNVVSAHGGVIGGGVNNHAGGTDPDSGGYATVGGGSTNRALGGGATVSGGFDNEAAGPNATIAGGYGNRAGGLYSTVAGGFSNSAQGAYSFAAGTQAKALHQGSFVWADSAEADFVSTRNNQFLIRASGNVGINNPNPVSTLTIGPNIPNLVPYVNSIMVAGPLGAAVFLGSDAGDRLSVGWENNSYGYIATRNAKPLAMQVSGGNVGIQTISPTQKLQVDGGNILVRGPDDFYAANNEAKLYLGDTNNYIKAINGGGVRIGTYGGADTVSILGSKVGIGTTNPEERLSVTGSIKVDQSDQNDGTFASGGLIKFGNGLTGEGIGSKRTTGGNWAGIDFYTGSSIKMTIANGGNVGIATTSPSYKLDVNGTLRCTSLTQSSDIRLKTDIRPLSNMLDSVLRLRGVSFDWKDADYPEGRQIGVIAQEVEKVFPELVSVDARGYESVAYDKLVPVLIEAVKEQQAQIDSRDARISDLEARLSRLEKLVEAR